MHVLMMTESRKRYKRLIDSAIKTDFEFELKNDLEMIAPLIDMIHQVSYGHNLFDENSQLQMAMAIEQAINNAMVRGNLEIKREDYPFVSRKIFQERAQLAPFRERTVYFHILVTRESQQRLPFRIQNRDSTLAPFLKAVIGEFSRRDGTDLVLIKTFMDRC